MSATLNLKRHQQIIVRLPADEATGEPEKVVKCVMNRRVVGVGYRFMSDDGFPRTFSFTQLHTYEQEGRLTIEPDNSASAQSSSPARHWEALSDQERQEAILRKNALDELYARYKVWPTRRLIEAFAKEIAGQPGFPLRVSFGSLQRWEKLYSSSDNDPMSLVDKPHEHHFRFNPNVKIIVDQIIDNHLLIRNHKSARSIWIFVEQEIVNENNKLKSLGRPQSQWLMPPSYQTICRYVEAVDDEERTYRQQGWKTAEDKYRTFKNAPLPLYAGSTFAIDHTVIDVYICTNDGIYLGRPKITIVQCLFSSLIVGYYISFEDSSFYAVAAALKHAMLPKPNLKDQYGTEFGVTIEHDGIEGGAPLCVIADNAPENHAKAMAASCERIGVVSVRYTPSKRPRFKGRLERFFRTMNTRVFHQLAGGIPHKPGDRPEIDPKKDTVLTFKQVHFLIDKFIVDIHPFQWQRGLGARPIDLWRESLKNHPLRRPPQLANADLLLAGIETRTIQPKGIAFKGGFYGLDDELRTLKVAAKGERREYEIRYDPSDLSFIYILDSDNKQYVKLTTYDKHLVGKSYAEASAYLKTESDKRRIADTPELRTREAAMIKAGDAFAANNRSELKALRKKEEKAAKSPPRTEASSQVTKDKRTQRLSARPPLPLNDNVTTNEANASTVASKPRVTAPRLIFKED